MSDHVTTTLGDLVVAADDTPQRASAWTRLIARDWPMKIAYHMKKLHQQIRPELQHFHELRDAAIRELGVEKDGGYAVTAENWSTFQARMAELVAQPVTLAWKPLQLADLGDVPISGADLAVLEPLVVGEPTP